MMLLVAGCAAEQGLEDGQEQGELVGEFEPMDTPFDPVQQKTPGGVHFGEQVGYGSAILENLARYTVCGENRWRNSQKGGDL